MPRALAALPLMLLLPGCVSNVSPSLPAELEVVLPAGEKTTVPVDTGPVSLANSAWAVFRKPDVADAPPADAQQPGPYGGLLGTGFIDRLPPDTLMGVAHFDEAGRFARLSQNAFYLPELVGEEIIADGEFHAARFPGMAVAARSYGATNGSKIGVAIAIDVRLLGLPFADAVSYMWGTLEADRIDGIFGYTADFTGGPGQLLVGPGGGDQYPAYALRQ